MNSLRAAFPWAGGKSRAAHLIWPRFGDVPNYVEPFAGSLAVLLARPHAPNVETVNDADCYLANFWRALAADPDGVARWADWPVNEIDLHARHRWLLTRAEFRTRLLADPDYYDIQVAGWWVWGVSAWIGSGWCAERWWRPEGGAGSTPPAKREWLGKGGCGVHRTAPEPWQQKPDLGAAGLGSGGRGIHRGSVGSTDLAGYLRALSARLRRVRVCCGDWTRVLGPTPTWRHGLTAILLDPPYSHIERQSDLYAVDRDVAAEVAAWAREHGDSAMLRIALCGLAGEHTLPATWTMVPWHSRGGYGNQGRGRGRENALREVIWFSPHCLSPECSPDLFSMTGMEVTPS